MTEMATRWVAATNVVALVDRDGRDAEHARGRPARRARPRGCELEQQHVPVGAGGDVIEREAGSAEVHRRVGRAFERSARAPPAIHASMSASPPGARW